MSSGLVNRVNSASSEYQANKAKFFGVDGVSSFTHNAKAFYGADDKPINYHLEDPVIRRPQDHGNYFDIK